MSYRNRIVETRLVPADELRRNPRNHRRHPDAQRTALRSLLGSVGVVKSLTAFMHPEHGLTLLDGEARWEEGGTWPVEIVDLSPDEADLALAMLDRIGAQAEIDPSALLDLLNGMDARTRATAGAAWDDATLLAMVGEQGLPEAGAGGDEFDPTPEDGPTRAQPGDLWVIGGKHRLIVGDCTDPAVVERVTGGERAALCVTDPPYNVKIGYGDQVDDDKTGEEYEQFSRVWLYLAQEHSVRQIVTPGGQNLMLWARWFDPFHIAAWTKPFSTTNGKVAHLWSWEPIFFFGLNWPRNRANDIFEYGIQYDPKLDGAHPCPKPIALWTDLLDSYTDRGALVYEPFCGSGTTIIAAHRTGRRCYGCEIEPRYADVILRRAEAEGLTCERA